MKKAPFSAMILLAVISLNSCTKIIDLDLQGHDQKVVIEARLGTDLGDNEVIVSASKPLNDPNPVQFFENATVTIKDLSTGVVYPLSGSGGIFNNDVLQAIEEHSYELKVEVNGQSFVSQATVPKNVELINLSQDGAAGEGTFGFADLAKLVPAYHDPLDYENYYQFVIYRNDTLQQDISIRDDLYTNGLLVSRQIFVEAKAGDLITVDFQGINKAAYTYLYAFNKNSTQTSGAPANPPSNISNGALGFFKVHTSNYYDIVIQ